MNIVENIKNFFFSADDDDIDDDEMPESEAPIRKPVVETSHHDDNEEETVTPSKASVYETKEFMESEPVSERNTNTSSNNNRRNKVVNIQTTAQLQVVLVKPSAFTDAKQVADHLIAKKTVVLNLETATPENKRRIIDFLAGVAYANGGSLKPVANLTYLITPYNVGFIGEDLVGELENNGVFI